MTRFVTVVGENQSENTSLTKKIVLILKNRGYQVATLNESYQAQNSESSEPSTDTKTEDAGAEIVVTLPENATSLVLKRRLTLKEIVPFLRDMDYVILEGFEKEKVFAKIIVGKTAKEVEAFSDGLAIAISGKIAQVSSEIAQVASLKIPILDENSQIENIVDLIEQKTFTILPNLVGCATCHSVGECGYVTCYEHAKAIISGESKTRICPLEVKEDVVVEINGVKLPLKNFPQTIIQNSLIGMFSSLHGVEEIKTIKIEINTNKK